MAALAVLGGYGSSEDSDDEAGASVSSDLLDRVAAVQRDEVPRHAYRFWSGNLAPRLQEASTSGPAVRCGIYPVEYAAS